MKVKKLTLTNFRNIRGSTFHPDPHLNFLIGANGQGKTSFIEALGYLATLRSFRGARSDEVIRWGETCAEISSSVSPDADDWISELKVDLSLTDTGQRKSTRKVAFINGKPYRNSTQYLSQRFGEVELGFHAVVFNPSDHDIVRGEPQVRRTYLDRVLAAEDVRYLKDFQRYQKLLDQRNAVLKTADSPTSQARDLLLGFTEPLARLAAELTFKRLQWIDRLTFPLDRIAHSIAPTQAELRLVYASNWVPEIPSLSIYNNKLSSVDFAGHGQLPSLETLEQAFWKKLSNLEEAEWRTRSSLVGPHRDDWVFYLGGQILRGHGSQGEVRSALLALKLAEIELFRDRTKQCPVLLLDDFSSELDQERRAFLLRFLLETDLQVFVTTTEDSTLLGKRFKVTDGAVIEQNEHRTICSDQA